MCYSSKRLALMLLAVVGLNSCGGNLFRDFVDPDANNYRIDSTKKYIDELDFNSAISTIMPVVDRDPRNDEAVYLAAVAYAGRAGLRIIDLLTQLVDGLSSKSILQIFASHIPGATASTQSDIETSMYLLERYGDRASKRTAKMNFFALFLYYIRIGVTLNRTALDGNNNLRANFHACHNAFNTAANPTGLTDGQVDTIYTSFARIIDTASSVVLDDSLDSIIDDLSLPVGIGFDNFCSLAGNSENVKCLAIRTLVNQGKSDSGVGLGVDPGDATPYMDGAGGFICDSLTP